MSLNPGVIFDHRFTIEDPARVGGMGAVYRAYDQRRKQTVALKLLHGDSIGQVEQDRFLREGQLMAELDHPGIVSYMAHGVSAEGVRFLAMEWLNGEDLESRLRRGPLSVPASIQLIRQIAAALAHAHARGIVHRDIKPSNLFLINGDVERAKLIDFGIARQVRTSAAMTRTGMVIGTPDYMSPEQARGERQITFSADVFSLGCVLYECLTGHPPFAAQHLAAILVRILFEDPEPITRTRPGVPAALASLLDRMLAKSPEQRPADAEALHAELRGLGSCAEIDAPILPVPSSKSVLLKSSDQGLLCVVLASPRDDTRAAETLAPESISAQASHRLELSRVLLSLNLHVEWMLDGTLVIVSHGVGNAVDQAAIAARAALIVRKHLPDVPLALVTDRGAVHQSMPIGKAAEKAAQLLHQQRSGAASPEIWLDELTARLIERKFTINHRPGFSVLTSENENLDAERPLLGKPTRCVGRETELLTLAAQYEGCVSESEVRVALVTAQPGVGKSRLLHEFLRRHQARDQETAILWGRGEPMSSRSPGNLLQTAIRRLCGLNIGESPEAQRRRLTERLARYLDARDVTRVTLFLAEFCGLSATDLASDALSAARQDHKLMREQLQRAFTDWLAAEAHNSPVLIILEDLHWGDTLSITLIEYALRILATTPIFVLALARPEVQETHPKFLHGHHRQELALKELSRRACEQLVRYSLGERLKSLQNEGDEKELLARIYEQSGGNALLLEELLRAAVEGQTPERSETAIAIIQTRYERLTQEVRHVLCMASIFGETFLKSGLVALLAQPSASQLVGEHLLKLVSEEIIYLQSEDRGGEEAEYRFRHALLREAAYSLLTDAARATGHRMAGTYLLFQEEHTPAGDGAHQHRSDDCLRAALRQPHGVRSDDAIFRIVSHLNHGANLLDNAEERLALARLNERAGLIAKSRTAYGLAVELFAKALNLLDEAMRQREEVLVRSISLQYADSLYRSGASTQAEAILDKLDAATVSGIERTRTSAIRIEIYQAAGQFSRAVSSGRAALAAIGTKFPEQEDELASALDLELANIMQRIASRPLSELADLPSLQDPLRLAELDLLMRLDTPAFPVSRTLSALISAKQVSLSLRYGNSNASAVCYMSLAVLLARLRSQFVFAHQLGEFALLLNAKSKTQIHEARLRYLYGSFLPFVCPLRDAINEEQIAFECGTRLGDMQGYFAASYILFFRIFAGDHVQEVCSESEKNLTLIRRTGNALAITLQRIGLQVLKCLAGQTHGPSSLSDDEFNEENELSAERCRAIPTARLWYYLTKLLLILLSGELSILWPMAIQAEEAAYGAAGLFIVAEFSFYYCLAGLQHAAQLSAEARAEVLVKLAPHRAKISTLSQMCAINFACKHELINAEWERLSGNVPDAAAAYYRSIELALQSKLPSCAAIAAELAARMFAELGNRELELDCSSKARAAFSVWGVKGKM